MQPVREAFASSTEDAIKKLNAAWKSGKLAWVKTPYWQDGWFGRGDVQLTHESNYSGPLRDAVKMVFDVDIHAEPDAVLRGDISAFVLIEGTMRAVTTKSDFTAFALEDFINDEKTDYENARKTVNPGDKPTYALVAGYARKFETAIRAARAAVGHEFVGATSPAGLEDGAFHDELVQVQTRLRDLGYPEVGKLDGRWGSKCAAAVLAFRNDNGLPTIPKVDDELLVALMRGKPRVVSVERATATAEDLKATPVVAEGLSLQTIGKIIAGGGLALGTGNGTLKFSEIPERIGELKAIGVAVQAALPYLMVGGVGLAVWHFAGRAICAHVAAYREGKIV
jgi:hypothetical protein